jgi:hypothetical protein
MSRALAAWAATLTALALAACGTDEIVQFHKDELRPAQARIEQAKSQISAQLQVVRLGRKRDSEAVAQLVSALNKDVGALAALKPPEALNDTFRRYVVAHRHLVGALRHFAELLAHHSKSALNHEATVAQSAAGEVARARDALDAKLTRK